MKIRQKVLVIQQCNNENQTESIRNALVIKQCNNQNKKESTCNELVIQQCNNQNKTEMNVLVIQQWGTFV